MLQGSGSLLRALFGCFAAVREHLLHEYLSTSMASSAAAANWRYSAAAAAGCLYVASLLLETAARTGGSWKD